MRTYRAMFALPEFAAFFAAVSAFYAAQSISGFALAVLIYARTGSALLSAVAMFGASFAQMIGAATLLSAADRARPRLALTTIAVIFVLATVALAVPGLPAWALLLIELATGLPSAMAGGVMWGLLNELVPEGGYILARSIFNMSNSVTQILGYAVGGALLALASARGALLVAAVLYLATAAGLRFGLTDRPAQSAGRVSILQTWTTNRQLWASSARRYIYLALWIPNGLIVGCVALFIPYAPHSAAVLYVAEGAGMLAGDTILGRFASARWRRSLIGPLRLLLAAPYLLFALHPSIPVAIPVITVASLGYGATLLLQERLIALIPDKIRGHALGLHSAGMLTMQAIGATIAGGIADLTSPSTAITILAAISLLIALALTSRIRTHSPVVDTGMPDAFAPATVDPPT